AKCTMDVLLRRQSQMQDDFLAAHPPAHPAGEDPFSATAEWLQIMHLPGYGALLNHEDSQSFKFHRALAKMHNLRRKAQRQQAVQKPGPEAAVDAEWNALRPTCCLAITTLQLPYADLRHAPSKPQIVSRQPD